MLGFIKRLFSKESIEDFEERAYTLLTERRGKLQVEKLSDEQVSRLAYVFSTRLLFRMQAYIQYLGDTISREALTSWEMDTTLYDGVDICIVAQKHTQIEELKELEAKWIRMGILYCLEDFALPSSISELIKEEETFMLADNGIRLMQMGKNNKVLVSGWTPFGSLELQTFAERLNKKFYSLYNFCEVESHFSNYDPVELD